MSMSTLERQPLIRPAKTVSQSLTEYSPVISSMAQQAGRTVPLIRVFQICLLQISTAIAFVLMNSTLNRVMIVEFKLDAWLVGVLIGLHNLFAFIRPVVGHYSDTHLLFGYRRTPNILLGNLITVVGLLLSVYGVVMMQTDFAMGLTMAVAAFLCYGLGVNITGTMYFALLADSAGDKHKSKGVTTGWFIMIVGSILTSAFIGSYLKDFTEQRLIEVFWIGAFATMALTWVALFGTEKRFAAREEIVQKDTHRVPLRAAMAQVVANPTVYRFFVFMFITVIAIQGQDVILEPFGAHIFGMSVAETTKLTQVWGAGTMLGILTLGLFFVNRIGKKKTTYIGCAVSALGFIAIGVSAGYGETAFKGGVFLLGVGNGALTVGTLTMMMDMTTKENAGLFMGLWGMAQAIANFLANAVGGGIRDVSLALTGSQLIGYNAAFGVEVLGLCLAMWMLRTILITELKEKTTLTEVVTHAD